MKPFDLIQAKAGAPIVDQDGKSCTFITHIPQADELQRVIVLDYKGTIQLYREDGRWSGDCKHFLLMYTIKRTWWFIVGEETKCNASVDHRWMSSMYSDKDYVVKLYRDLLLRSQATLHSIELEN